jgi:tetratricopeptide (TPR) repeat protein
LTLSKGASSENTQKSVQESVPQSMIKKALYNLASTSSAHDEKQLYLEELLKLFPDDVPALIMYSRLLNHDDALQLLRQTTEEVRNPLIELELIKQNRGYAEQGRTAADTWLLLGHYPNQTEIYEWASYFFEEMRMFDEADQLEKNASYNNINGHWFDLQKAFDAMRNGELNQAEEILKIIPPEYGWEISANLGLIKEKQLSFTEAMTYYETASSLCKNNKNQALIQFSIARCFRAMGNLSEAIGVLNYAQELDPDNLRVRLEIRKLRDPLY